MSGQQRQRVLVIDDDSDIREMVLLCLERAGYEAEGAAGGQQALLRLTSAPAPALILLDLMMPAMSGQQLWQVLRALPELAEVAVVAISGDHAVREHARAMGLRSYLKKPFALSELLAVVQQVLGGGTGSQGPAGRSRPSPP